MITGIFALAAIRRKSMRSQRRCQSSKRGVQGLHVCFLRGVRSRHRRALDEWLEKYEEKGGK